MKEKKSKKVYLDISDDFVSLLVDANFIAFELENEVVECVAAEDEEWGMARIWYMNIFCWPCDSYT